MFAAIFSSTGLGRTEDVGKQGGAVVGLDGDVPLDSRSSTTLKSISVGAPLFASNHEGSLISFRSEGLKSNCQQSLLFSA
jgi:hypothetical protein